MNDPSFTGESGGNVRYMASPDINTEDFMAAYRVPIMVLFFVFIKTP